MIPILFGKNEKSFTSNGLGRLVDAISCTVTEERNGQFELEMIYPLDGALFELIENDMIIGVIPSVDATLQAFDVYSISKPLNGKVLINARHISYRLSQIVTTGGTIEASNSACSEALASLKTNAILASGQTFDFDFETDVTTVATFKRSVPASVRSRLGGSEGSILDQFGGEYEWDNFMVKHHRYRGVESNITIRYGKNLTDLTQEETNGEIATGCVGYWRNDSEIVVSDVQLASNHASFPREKIVAVDFTQSLGVDAVPTKQAVNNAAQVYANRHNLPKVNMKVSFVDLAQTEEYKNYAPLEKIHLCDKVYIKFEKLGVAQYAKIIKTVYNVLEDRYKSLEIGDNISTLFETITDSLASEIDEVSFAALNATAWLTRGDGYVVAVKNNDGSWKELLFMDTNDTQTARNVLRINTNGLGFSTTGVNGIYTNAWTIDGHLVADFIDTGTLNASLVNVTNLNASNITSGTLDGSKANITNINAGNIQTGTLDASKVNVTNINASNINTGTLNAANVNVTNINANNITTGSIDARNVNVTNINASNVTTGTMSADRMRGGTLELGGASTDGKLVVKDASNNNIFVAQKDKIEISGDKFTVSSTNFSLTSNGILTANSATFNNARINTAEMSTIECTGLYLAGNVEMDCGYGGKNLLFDTDGLIVEDTSVQDVEATSRVKINGQGVWYGDWRGNWSRIG